MKKPISRLVMPALLLSCSSLAFAGTVTYSINFEQLPTYSDVGTTYAGDDVTFSNAMQLNNPDYDYFDFPTHSGLGLITDEGNGDLNDSGDAIVLSFSVGMGTVTGWYTDPAGITVTAYDAAGNVISTVSDGAEYGADGFFSISDTSGTDPIASISIEDSGQNYLQTTVDDVSFTTTPEPGSIVLLGTGLLGLAGAVRRKFAR